MARSQPVFCVAVSRLASCSEFFQQCCVHKSAQLLNWVQIRFKLHHKLQSKHFFSCGECFYFLFLFFWSQASIAVLVLKNGADVSDEEIIVMSIGLPLSVFIVFWGWYTVSDWSARLSVGLNGANLKMNSALITFSICTEFLTADKLEEPVFVLIYVRNLVLFLQVTRELRLAVGVFVILNLCEPVYLVYKLVKVRWKNFALLIGKTALSFWRKWRRQLHFHWRVGFVCFFFLTQPFLPIVCHAKGCSDISYLFLLFRNDSFPVKFLLSILCRSLQLILGSGNVSRTFHNSEKPCGNWWQLSLYILYCIFSSLFRFTLTCRMTRTRTTCCTQKSLHVSIHNI